jgi:Tfp pilus assembly protein FimV
MAAVMTTPRFDPRPPAAEYPRPVRLTLAPPPAEGVGHPPRISAATYRRRRFAVLLAVVFVVLAAGQAGAALGSSPLAAPARPPSVVRYVVQPGDSLWTVAGRVAPDEDPRAVVDALADARRGEELLVGETIVWQR